MASGPLIDGQLAARIAFDQSTHRSFVDMNDYQGVNNPREFKSTSIRGKLLLTPKGLEDFTAKLTVSHTEQEAPQTESVRRPFDDHEVSYPNMPKFVPRATNGILDTSRTFADGLPFEHKIALTDTTVDRLAMPGAGKDRNKVGSGESGARG